MLPFSHVNDYELLDLLESTEKCIKRKLNDKSFENFIYSRCLFSQILDKKFDYYTLDQYNSQISSSQTDQVVWHQNIRSLDKHFGELMAFKELINNPLITCLTEIGRKNIENRQAQLQNLGYNMKFEKPQKVRGGVAIIYPKDTKLEEREDLHMKKPKNTNILDFENGWYETKIKGIGTVVIGIIYKHPNTTIAGLKEFKCMVRERMETINNEKKIGVILGDINIDALRIKNTETKEFFDMALDSDFVPIVTCPTRIAKDSCTIIDHIFVNKNLLMKTSRRVAGNIYADLSDHLPNFLALGNNSTTSKTERPKVRIYGEKNTQKFKQELQTTNWDTFYSSNCPKAALEILYNNYNQAFEASFPLKTLSRTRAKDKPWINQHLRKLLNKKHTTHTQYLLNPTKANRKRRNRARNIANAEREKAMNSYYNDMLNIEKANLRTLWKVAGSIINPSKMKSDTNIKSLKINNNTTSDNKKIAEAMNDFFSTVGKVYANKVKTEPNKFKKYLSNPNTYSLDTLQDTTVEEVTKIITSLKSGKSAGDDGIKPGLLKQCCHELKTPITHLMNLSLRNSTVPEKLKLAKVIPIYKKNDRTDPSNYRPISLLSILDKILEKLINKRVTSFLDAHKILYKYQFGFRPNHSTVQAVVEIADNIISEVNQGYLVAGIYMDLSKAFDTVDHKILLYKMEHYGIRGSALQWFKSYLSNRQQFTEVNGVKSVKQPVEYGVPQGSVLGPLLFLLYVNDISTATEGHKTRLFADDSNVFVTSKDPVELKTKMQKVIEDMFRWFSANKLTANTGKTQYSIFCKPNKQVPQVLNSLQVLGSKLERSVAAKYLGVTLDDKLTWKQHIDTLTAKLSKTIAAFKIVKNYVNVEQKRSLYFAYIFSRIQYGIELFSSSKKKDLKQVQTKQNRALKVLFNKEHRTPTRELHKELNLLQVQDIGQVNILKFVHKQRLGDTPEAFNNYFTEVNEHHNINTRQAKNLHVPRENNWGMKSMKYRGAVLWNKTDNEIRDCKTTKTFAGKVKKLIINTY